MKNIAEPVVQKQDKKFETDTLKTIYERRAVRKYKDEQVDKHLIEQIIDAGRMAPSAINKQPWKFYVLTDKEDIQIFSKEISKAAIKGFVSSGIKGIIRTTKDFLMVLLIERFLLIIILMIRCYRSKNLRISMLKQQSINIIIDEFYSKR